ncbi:MAG: DUF1365 domain-containing protein [Sphingomicrobium sp.]
MTDGALYIGSIHHRRLRPKVHLLDYRIFSLLIDIDRIDALDRRLGLFSVGRFNLLSFRAGDFGDGSGTPLRTQVEALLARAGIAAPARIELLAMPRLLGFAFNPLSLWYCTGRSGGLSAIVYEVHNTFGERHFYVAGTDGQGPLYRHRAAKAFHVSPFLPMDLDYRFQVQRPGEGVAITIEVRDKQGPLLVAVQNMERRALTDGAILRAALAMPLMTAKVVGGILWEAARLWWKGIAVHRHPGPRAAKVTFADEPRGQPERAEAA